MNVTSPIAIDLSRLPPPDAILPLDHPTLLAAFVTQFLAYWEDLRATRPELPSFTAESLATDPAIVIGRVTAYLRLLDRAMVNNAIRAVLAPLAKKADLDNVVARQGVVRLETAPGVPETDEQLFHRYLLSFGRAAAGSIDRILFDAWKAWPAMWDARVNGFAVHGRRGETDLVIAGAGGITPTENLAAVRAAVTAPSSKVEAIGMFVLAATPLTYAVSQVIKVPVGPDAELVRLEAAARVAAATDARHLIGGTIQRDLVAGSAYGASIAEVAHASPTADVAASPYQIPVRTDLSITVEVQG
ncbi:baseplate J/gp47 family protein [Bosea sp. TAB14]|uniref:baseplate J/gp47 family protein n=1 Tax=Bosea sp. TAB14 TaxID=3237481 RepID=UPI003F920E4F